MATVILVLTQDLVDVRQPTVSLVVETIESVLESSDAREIHLMVAGSKQPASHIDIHNKHSDRSEWDKAWTSGEQVFAEICYGIGMEKFGARTGLRAHSFDVGPSDGLQEIAEEAKHILIRKYCDKVATVLVVLPPHLLEAAGAGDAVRTVRISFSKVWFEKGSIFTDASVEFVGDKENSFDEVENPAACYE